MKTSKALHVWGAVVLLTLAIGGQAAAQANQQVQQDDFVAESISCFSSYAFGAGSTLFNFCLSNHGNIVRLTSPVNFEHIAVGTTAEGYVVCDLTGGVNYHDTASLEAGWNAPSSVSLPGTLPFTVVRTTTDGRFTLTQVFNRNTVEKEIRIDMTVRNNTAQQRNVLLLRYFDGDVNNDPGDDRYARTRDAVWAWEDRQTGLFHGLKLRTRSHGLDHDTFVQTFPGTRTTCSPAPLAATPTGLGDFVGSMQHRLVNIPAGGSVTVSVIYERF
jgi:hypothetical protein